MSIFIEEGKTALVRILLVDDHELIRRNIRRLLASQTEFEFIGEAISGLEAIREARENQPDVILLDISLPEMSGLAALPLIQKAAPLAKVLMVTNHDDPDFARAAFSLGACGFLTKADVAAELAFAIRHVHAGKRFLSKRVTLEDEAKPIAPPVSSAEA